MVSAKLASSGLLNIMVFSNKDYVVTVSAHDVTNNIFSHDSNVIVDVAM